MSLFDKLLTVFAVAVLVFLYAPIANMIFFSFNSVKSFSYFQEFSLQWYVRLFSNREVWTAFYNSIWVGAVVTVISVALGILMANAVVRYRFRGMLLVDMLIYIPIIIPEITESLSLLIMYIFLDFPLGAWSVILGHVAFSISFATVVLRARLVGFEKATEEAARTLGANELQTFLRVTFPLMMPGIIAAALMVFTISFDDFIKTMFTTGPGFKTLPLLIWTSASRGGVSLELNSLSTFALSISLLFALLRIRALRGAT